MDDSSAKGPIHSHPLVSGCDGGGRGGGIKWTAETEVPERERITENKMTPREQYGAEDVERRSSKEGTQRGGKQLQQT